MCIGKFVLISCNQSLLYNFVSSYNRIAVILTHTFSLEAGVKEECGKGDEHLCKSSHGHLLGEIVPRCLCCALADVGNKG
jgi:hypothetical protein